MKQNKTQKNKKDKLSAGPLPKSVTSMSNNIWGVVGLFVAVRVIRLNQIEPFLGAIIIMLSVAVPIIVLEAITLKPYQRASTGLNFKIRNSLDLNRIMIKLLGLYLCMGLIALIYLTFPEYRNDFYLGFWRLCKYIVPIILIGSIPYYIFMDRFLVEPKESYYNGQISKIYFWGGWWKGSFCHWCSRS